MTAELTMIEGETDPLIGSTIDGRYQVESVLGEGGMGLVYKARHTMLGKSLAIKVLRRDVCKNEEIMTRFRQEAQSATAIGNQHIIDISDFGTLPDGSTYFIMEYLDGVDLGELIDRKGKLDPGVVLHVTMQLCRGLGAAHAAGIVHRDMKPDNVHLLNRGGDEHFVKVLDFGIAKVGGSSSKLTRAGQVFGTPHYMSPEQCSGTGVDHRTDIYALGIMMYEMLTGVCPFDADNLMGILTKHLHETAMPPRQLDPSIPEGMERVVLRAMEKDIDARYQTMEEMLVDLEGLANGVLPAKRDVTRSFIAEGEEESGTKWGVWAAALVALASIVGLAVVFSGGDEEVNAQPDVVDEPAADIAEPEEPEQVEEPEVELEPETGMETADSASQYVQLQSIPAGAEVFIDGESIGNAPVRIERPEEGAVLVELRRDGYFADEYRVTQYTADQVDVELRRRPRVRMNGGMTAMTQMTVMTQMTGATTTMQGSNSETLDPWANMAGQR